MAVPSGIIIAFKGVNASIPTGWSRETSLDGKYIKGAANGVDPDTTGGSSTHSHNATANHSHNEDGHTHTLTVNAASGGSRNTASGTGGAEENHTHSDVTFSTSSGGGLSSVAATYDSVSNDPPYYEVIFISSGGTNDIPDNCSVFFDRGYSIPSGFISDTDFTDKYLKGAGTSADAGGTGGSTTNVHTLSHTHTVNTHTHTYSTGAAEQEVGFDTSSPKEGVAASHTHSGTTSAVSDTISATAPEVTTTETVEPEYSKLFTITNNSGGEKGVVRGMVAMWLGTLSSIPSDWEVYSALEDKFVKITNTESEIEDTGGSATHSHSDDMHTHTSTGHSHTVGALSHSTTVDESSGTPDIATNSSTHSTSVTTTSPTYENATTSSDSANNEPEYRTVAFVKYAPVNPALAILAPFM